MMSEKQAAFRETFRRNIEKWYSGPLHVVSIYAIGFGGIAYFGTSMSGTRWWDWLVVILVFLGCNVFEWYLHKRTMHRRVKGLGAIYQRHTVNHHQFFTSDEMRIDRIRDYRIVFFPPYALVAFMVLSILPAAAAWALVSASAGWIVMITTTAFYLNYELFHLSCHVEERPYLRHLPFINTVRRHHEVHHNQRVMMDTNLNLTYPIADWLFGTSDLDRGLLGHIFNGYSGAHLKKGMAAAQGKRTVGAPA